MDSARDSEFSARLRSISSIRNDSFDDVSFSPKQSVDEKHWRLSYLKEQFESFELHHLFRTYTAKINHGYFSIFLILQSILSGTHFTVTLITNYNDPDNLIKVTMDLTLLSIALIFCVTGLFVVDKVVLYKKLRLLTCVAFFIAYFLDVFLPIYHSKYIANHGRYRPLYTPCLILSCYIFFDIYNKMNVFLLAIFVTISGCAVRAVITYENNNTNTLLWQKVATDIIFFICINGVGLFFRFINEIAIRKSFLDRREFITSTFQLRHEKKQMENLMANIIPKYLIEKVIDMCIENEMYYIRTQKILHRNPFSNTSTLLDEHENVTILFADIVHYTEMTQKLDINELLETLNDLFGEFDDISEQLGVTRIKFLGDCYYCVAGLPPEPIANHADAIVDLGLAMISVIATVRKKRKLNIDMRIGVHSGRITSGIIGSLKHQFDIWSKDVDIANKMESEGCPGKVHITHTTKDLLTNDKYIIVPTDKGEKVPQFKTQGIQTFFISPQEDPVKSRPSMTDSNGRLSVFYKNGLRKSKDDLQTFIKQQSIEEVDETNQPAIAKNSPAPLSIIERNNVNYSSNHDHHGNEAKNGRRRYSNNPRASKVSDRHVNLYGVKRRTAFMNNNIKRYGELKQAIHKEMEETVRTISFSKYKQYFQLKDINFVTLTFKQRKTECDYIRMPDPLFKYYLAFAGFLMLCIYCIQDVILLHVHGNRWAYLAAFTIIIFVFPPLSWTHFLWTRCTPNGDVESPKNIILHYLCESSKLVTSNFLLRLSLYTSIYILTCVISMIELSACKDNFNLFGKSAGCIVPWHVTEICCLVILMTFIFLRIFIWIKLIFYLIVIGLYALMMFFFNDGFYEPSESFDIKQPKISHLISVAFMVITLHLIDRQTDYMNRRDFLVNAKIKQEQDNANGLKIINKKLLDNILPDHVARIYLDVNREMKELYYEEHENVAVMFASLIYDEELLEMPDKQFLSIMNEYITKFDTLINRKQFCHIEKIKLAKWTYMAACGLKDREANMHNTSSSLETLLNFASEMFKALSEVNNNMNTSALRIGICSGPIVAGVVGSKKPLYDIWGDAVNMASRMDTTGEPNRIQVMEHTADLIKGIGFQCEYRGEISVKGKDHLVKTYFVKLDEDFNLVRMDYCEL